MSDLEKAKESPAAMTIDEIVARLAAEDARAKERRRIKNLIRNGKLPRFAFVRDVKGHMERAPKQYHAWVLRDGKAEPRVITRQKLTWRTVSTVALLMGEVK